MITSAGILMYRRGGSGIELLLAHPGGPFWSRKDEGAWSIPKGLCGAGEELEATARREFAEETGHHVEGELIPLGVFKLMQGKVLHAFAVEGDLDADAIVSNTFELEWPPRSGAMRSYPEIDRAAWFPLEDARRMIHKRQAPFIDALLAAIDPDGADEA
jgi:predicted NUDIX family NTP pyrophosphohydrolase